MKYKTRCAIAHHDLFNISYSSRKQEKVKFSACNMGIHRSATEILSERQHVGCGSIMKNSHCIILKSANIFPLGEVMMLILRSKHNRYFSFASSRNFVCNFWELRRRKYFGHRSCDTQWLSLRNNVSIFFIESSRCTSVSSHRDNI